MDADVRERENEVPLDDVFRAVRAVCLEGKTIAEAFGPAAAGLDRLSIYRSFVCGHLERILSHVYPRTLAAIGNQQMAILRDEFYREFPPASWDQNANAQPFVGFLRDRDIEPHVVELADYEWWDFAVAVSTEVVPPCGAIPAPIINPTLALRTYRFDVAGWARSERGPGTGSRPAPAEHTLALWRHPAQDRTYVLALTPLSLIVLKMIFERSPREQVIAETGLAGATLDAEIQRLGTEGLLLLPSGLPSRG